MVSRLLKGNTGEELLKSWHVCVLSVSEEKVFFSFSYGNQIWDSWLLKFKIKQLDYLFSCVGDFLFLSF